MKELRQQKEQTKRGGMGPLRSYAKGFPSTCRQQVEKQHIRFLPTAYCLLLTPYFWHLCNDADKPNISNAA